MDLKTIEKCLSSTSDLEREYGVGLAEDDCRQILHNFQSIKTFFITTFLQENKDNDKSFPIGFILNTGNHQNGGLHWQALYFDRMGMSYFFDSYGRKSNKLFSEFEHLIRTLYYYFELFDFDIRTAVKHMTVNSLKKARENAKRFKTTQTINYFDHQIQDDNTNVCGEYSTYFLYNISLKVRDPAVNAYTFFIKNFFYFKSKEDKKSCPSIYRNQWYIRNDQTIQKIFYRTFSFHLKNIFSQ